MLHLQLFKIKYFCIFCLAFVFLSTQAKKFEPDNEHIQMVGRIDKTDPKAPIFSASGTYIIVKFKGSSCEIELKDEHKWEKNRNYFQVIIDKQPAKRYQTEIGKSIYKIAENLSNEEHSLKVIKDSEGSIGYLQFMGIDCDELLPPPALPERKIECFGNSITCGAGTIVSLCDTSKDSNWYLCTSAYHSYGYLLAEKLNTQYHLTSQSGIGLIHSCCNMPNTMLDSYDRLHIDKPDGPKWDFNNYVPDIVTLALGQNDGVQDSALFCGKYIDFVKTLKIHYPAASFFLLSSPMSDDTLLAFQKMVLSSVEAYFTKEGDSKVHKIILRNKLNAGCTNHPDAEQHKIIAEELSREIKKVMNW